MIDLETFDTDEAIGMTRSSALAVGGGAVLALMVPRASLAKGHVAILNYGLTLEYLEAAFYTEAELAGKLTGELAFFAKIVGAHERNHVAALKGTLGSKAV